MFERLKSALLLESINSIIYREREKERAARSCTRDEEEKILGPDRRSGECVSDKQTSIADNVS